MRHPIQHHVLSNEEKCQAGGVPAQIVEFEPETDTFLISPDWARYNEGSGDQKLERTDFVDFKPFSVPAICIGAFTDSLPESPEELVGEFIIIPHPGH
ncbi:hypothetical protein [Achromobacter sp. AGC39]